MHLIGQMIDGSMMLNGVAVGVVRIVFIVLIVNGGSMRGGRRSGSSRCRTVRIYEALHRNNPVDARLTKLLMIEEQTPEGERIPLT